MDFLKLLKPKATHSKNGFDLSRKHVFSSKAGQLRPCLCVESVPNDTFEIDVAALSRSMTLNTAAFLRGKMRYDFFFVPYSQLWHPFNQFISQRTDRHSVNQKNHLHCPVLNLKSLLYFLIDMFDGNASLYEVDVHGYDAVYTMVDNLNLLGYGDFRFVYSSTLSTSSKQTYADKYDGKYVNIFRLAAFQHIWYDYYRNKYYDVDNTGGIQTDYSANLFSDVDMFNFDDIDCSSLANAVIPIGNNSQVSDPTLYRIMRLLQPRYVQYKKDLFTSRLPGQQFGAVSSLNITNEINNANNVFVKVTGLQAGNISSLSVDTSKNVIANQGQATYGLRAVGSFPSSFDVLSLRKAELLQVWKQRTLRAGNMVDDSFEAHYGVKPYYEDENNVNYLGSFSASLQINAVESTANAGQTLNGKVGDIAATGTCVVNGKKIRFNPKDFGIIMCCSSFLPESEYNSTGIDKANTLCEQFDFFTPEFENIGLEAVPLREFSFDYVDAPNSEKVIGYAPRYWMYKEARDKVFGEFMSVCPNGVTNSLCSWVSPREINPYINAGVYYVQPSDLYVNPDIFDNIFAINADGKSITDTFLNNVYFDIKALRPMSELGLPQF